jgi:hypothetical protein
MIKTQNQNQAITLADDFSKSTSLGAKTSAVSEILNDFLVAVSKILTSSRGMEAADTRLSISWRGNPEVWAMLKARIGHAGLVSFYHF